MPRPGYRSLPECRRMRDTFTPTETETTMKTPQNARARKEAQIETVICTECFCAIPAEQKETHAEWHVGRASKDLAHA